jgi:hypothetical protein
MSNATSAQVEDFFSDFPKAERDALQVRVDDLVEQLNTISENRGLLDPVEQARARTRAFRDSGFPGGPAGLLEAQERLRLFSEGQGAIRTRGEGTGPADVDGSALGDIPTGADKMSPQQREEFGVVIQGLGRADAIQMIRTAEPDATQADIDAILALQGL